MPACDVVIVNFNTGELLSECVDAVKKSLHPVNIFLIDNHSSDTSMQPFKGESEIQVHLRQKNFGFASSVNYGAEKGESEFILILNPDCIIEPNTIELLIADFKNSEKLGMVGCLVTNSDGTEQKASRRQLPTFWRTLMTVSKLEKLSNRVPILKGVNLNHQEMPSTNLKVEAISGAIMLVKRTVFEELDGLDEKFPMHFEDLDLMKRIQSLGYEISFNPNVKVKHYQGVSSQTNPRVEKMKRQGLLRYFKKHGTSLSHWIIKKALKKSL